MLYLVVFLLVQIGASLLVKYFSSLYWRGVFRVLFIPAFIGLMAVYPIWVIDVYYIPDEPMTCGLPIMAMMFFFWVIGIPVTIITQLLLNKKVLKLKPTNKNIN